MPDFKLINAPETPYLYAERSCSMDPEDITKNMGIAFQKVWDFLQANNIKPAGGALSVYYEHHPDKLVFRAGFTIDRADMAKAKGDVKADVTPAAEVIHYVHKGPYATLRDDYELMMKHIVNIGREISAPTWEIYLNSPDQVPEEELLTEVYSVIK